jgi:hypothetical protein
MPQVTPPASPATQPASAAGFHPRPHSRDRRSGVGVTPGLVLPAGKHQLAADEPTTPIITDLPVP